MEWTPKWKKRSKFKEINPLWKVDTEDPEWMALDINPSFIVVGLKLNTVSRNLRLIVTKKKIHRKG